MRVEGIGRHTSRQLAPQPRRLRASGECSLARCSADAFSRWQPGMCSLGQRRKDPAALGSGVLFEARSRIYRGLRGRAGPQAPWRRRPEAGSAGEEIRRQIADFDFQMGGAEIVDVLSFRIR